MITTLRYITISLLIYSFNSSGFADTIINLNSPNEIRLVSEQGKTSNDSIENNKFLQLQELRRLGLVDDVHVNTLLRSLYSQTPDINWKTLKTHAQALRYGIPIHQAIETTLTQQGGSRYLTQFSQFLGAMGIFKKHMTPFFTAVSECGASPLVFHGSWAVSTLLGSSYPDSHLEQQILMMEKCKLSKTLNQNVRAGSSIEPELKEIVSSFEFDLTDLIIQGNSEMEQIRDAIHQAQAKEGTLMLIMFTGTKKYQFYLLGAYQNKLNLFYIANNKKPTPVAVFSMPKDQINEEDLVRGIYSMKNGLKQRDLVPTLSKSALLLSHVTASFPFERMPEPEGQTGTPHNEL